MFKREEEHADGAFTSLIHDKRAIRKIFMLAAIFHHAPR